jgi:carbon-monoxide dehydrogenase large subunit
VEPDGTFVVRSPFQTPGSCAQELAALFNVPPSRLKVITPYGGGGFGGKTGPCIVEPIVLLLAIKSRRPVRLELTREEQFIDSRQRTSVITYIKDGVRRDGTLVAREIRVIVDCGRHAVSALLPTRNLAFGAVGTYRIPNFKLDSYAVYTNNPVTGAYRGFGSPEVTWAIEQHMDTIAERLGIDAIELREKNILREGDKDVCGQTTYGIGIERCLEKVKQWIGWETGLEKESGWRIGKGVAIGNKYTIGGTSSVATVKVHHDGFIEVRHGAAEIGQGLNTMVAQIAAEEFGVSLDHIRVTWGDSAYCPYDLGCVSSRCTFHTGNAVKIACQDAKRQLLEMAAGIIRANPDDLEIKGGDIYQRGLPKKQLSVFGLFNLEGVPIKGGEILGTGSYHGHTIKEEPETGQSEKIVLYYTHVAQAAEVAVDSDTGEVKLLRFVSATDPSPINPKMVEAQVEGGAVQGIGSTLFEEVLLDNGIVTNPDFVDYKIPGTMDLPNNDAFETMIVPLPHQEGPFGAKGVAEATMVPTAAAIANAIYDATGARITDLPISREKILAALKESKKESVTA